MRYFTKHIMVILMLLLVPIYLISCSGNATTSLPSDNNSVTSKAEPPGRPTALTAAGADSHVDLRWTPPHGATSYNLYWSKTGGVTKASDKILNVSMPFAHLELMNGTTYYYRVSALNIFGESPLSDGEVQATPMVPFSKILTKLMDPDAEVGEEFGRSVSIDGDYAVVGAWYSSRLDLDDFIPLAGAAYVFHRKNGVWDPDGAKLMASDAQYFDLFGVSVSISGDYVIIGAQAEDGGPGDTLGDAGAAYIFHRIGENAWDGGVKIVAPSPLAQGFFGGIVSISGDYAVVGMTTGKNSVFVFRRTGTNAWESWAELLVPDSELGDRFGMALAISGDYIIVGAPFEDGGIDNSLPDSGAAYIFHRTGLNSWDQVSKIMPHDISAGAWFGYSVAIHGDYAAVGAVVQANRRGSVYVFHRLAENFWDEGPKLVAPDAQEGDEFGSSVGITDQYVIVGAPREDCGWDENMNEGSAYVYKRIGANTWDGGTKITIPAGDVGDGFGYAVAISGDHAIIGAYQDDLDEGSEKSQAGAVYLY